MNFKSVSVIKHPLELVWTSMRDRMPEVAEAVSDIESVLVESRDESDPASMHLVNVWKAAPDLPDFIAKQIKPEMLSWTDRADWEEEGKICRWEIEHGYFKERMKCAGTTTYEAAMGGRGTRVTFEGTIEWSSIPGFSGLLDGVLNKGVESVVTKVIPNNFRKLIGALGGFLDGKNA